MIRYMNSDNTLISEQEMIDGLTTMVMNYIQNPPQPSFTKGESSPFSKGGLGGFNHNNVFPQYNTLTTIKLSAILGLIN